MAGKYCSDGGQFKSGVRCPIGYYCPGGSLDKLTCIAPPGSYCPEGTSTTSGTVCDAGIFCAGGKAPPVSCPSPSCPTAGMFTMQLYKVPAGTTTTPLDLTQGTLIGENRLVTAVAFSNAGDVQKLVPSVGSDWFGWIFYGLVHSSDTTVFSTFHILMCASSPIRLLLIKPSFVCFKTD